MKELLGVAKVPFDGACEPEGVMCALKGSDPPPFVRQKIVRKIGKNDVPGNPMAWELVAMLGIPRAKDCPGQPPSAPGDVQLSHLASYGGSHLVQFSSVRPALFEHAKSLDDSCQGLALIHLDNFCPDERALKHDNFKRHVEEHLACLHAAHLIQKIYYYIHSDFFLTVKSARGGWAKAIVPDRHSRKT
mmetsp:Transcript_2210/g.6975  ORF Transcript_2210/g.6975 Transcript_2210/m.6975 type:complete len:189 (-) Transcript_2210:359-925(-)